MDTKSQCYVCMENFLLLQNIETETNKYDHIKIKGEKYSQHYKKYGHKISIIQYK